MSAPVALIVGDDAEVAAAIAARLGRRGYVVVASLGAGADGFPSGFGHLLDPLERTAEGGAACVVAAEAIGPVHALVTVPGAPVAAPILRGSITSMDDDHQRLVSWQFGAAREVAPAMVARRAGRLMFVSSVGALWGTSFEAPYGAASAAVIGLARALARELGPRQVTSNVVLAGPMASLRTTSPASGSPRHETHLAEVIRRTPRGRLCEPADIAAAVSYLASPLAAFTTGALIPVDGGLSMGFG